MDLNQVDAAGTSVEYPALDTTSDEVSEASLTEDPLDDAGQGSEGEGGEAESEAEDGSEIWENESLLEDVLEGLADDNVFHCKF
jgi:hypothetical protein